jgi:N-hydroxyarylamine O-acetyltransferase
MDIDAYCARIRYDGARTPTLEALRAIALCHPRAIAFENVSVAAGGVPDLSLDALEAKLVRSKRGGYCYEQTGLLQAALTAFGFAVTGLAARVRYRLPPDLVTPRSHMVLRVDLPEGRFLVDGGFGGLTLTAPVMLDTQDAQVTPYERVRLVRMEADYRLQVLLGDEWVDVYQFDLAPQLPPDYVQQNWHTATRPNSMFGNNLVAGRPVQGGRYVLFNHTLTWRPQAGDPERRQLQGAEELRGVLRDIFDLEIPDAEFSAAAAVANRGQALNPGFA